LAGMWLVSLKTVEAGVGGRWASRYYIEPVLGKGFARTR